METRDIVALTIIVLLTIGVLALSFRTARKWLGNRTFRKILLRQLVISAITAALVIGIYKLNQLQNSSHAYPAQHHLCAGASMACNSTFSVRGSGFVGRWDT